MKPTILLFTLLSLCLAYFSSVNAQAPKKPRRTGQKTTKPAPKSGEPITTQSGQKENQAQPANCTPKEQPNDNSMKWTEFTSLITNQTAVLRHIFLTEQSASPLVAGSLFSTLCLAENGCETPRKADISIKESIQQPHPYTGFEILGEGIFKGIKDEPSAWHTPQIAIIEMELEGKVPVIVRSGPLGINKWRQVTVGSRVSFRGTVVGQVWVLGFKANPLVTVYDAEPLDTNLSTNPNPSSPSDSKRQASTIDLIRAASNGDTPTILCLLKKAADLNGSVNGVTPLMLASFNGDIEAVKLLLAKGANVNAKTQNGGTALMIAVRRGHTELVKAFIAKSADVNAISGNWSVLRIAEIMNELESRTDIINALKTAGAQK